MCFNAVKIEANFYGLNSEGSKQNSWLHFEQSADLERERTYPRLWGFPLTAEEEELGIEIVTTRCSDGAPETMEEPVYPFSFLRSFMDSLLDSCRHKKYFSKEFIYTLHSKICFPKKEFSDRSRWMEQVYLSFGCLVFSSNL